MNIQSNSDIQDNLEVNKELIELIQNVHEVSFNTNQYLQWYFLLNEPSSSSLLANELITKCSPNEYFSNFVIEADEDSVVLTTPDFLFTENNIRVFSAMLLDVAKSCNCRYDFWEITLIPLDNNN